MSQAVRLSDALSKEELRELSTPSDVKAIASLVLNWTLIVAAFAVPIIWTNPLTIFAAIVFLGGRQLGLGILNHDCAHHAFVTSKKGNDFIGHWLCGAPMNISVYAYRAYHLKHHKYAGTPQDPDKIFVKNYPVSKDSLKRKLLRDVTGRTGFRDTMMKIKGFKLKKHYPCLAFHVALLAVLTAVGAPWAYLMWWAAEIFIYPVLTRVRQIGEHGVALDRDSLDPRDNTSTTLASWWERLLIAPNQVNYHLEHHHFAAVPGYNLPRLHKLLSTRGYYRDHDCITHGYLDVLKRAVRHDETENAVAA